LIYPGEFYLPTDCPVFLNIQNYEIKRHTDSVFSSIFKNFHMPSYSNYPYPYQFDNDEEQFRISEIIRNKVETIKSKSPEENFMTYEISKNDEIKVSVCREGMLKTHVLHSDEKDIYMAAVEEIRHIQDISGLLDVSEDRILSILNDFEEKGLILYSPGRKSFLSLATKARKR